MKNKIYFGLITNAVVLKYAGSRNNETTYFGPATRSALARYQSANNIYPSVGYFGPLTRTFINKGR